MPMLPARAEGWRSSQELPSGAVAFLGFFFSLLCELLPLPIVVASVLEWEVIKE